MRSLGRLAHIGVGVVGMALAASSLAGCTGRTPANTTSTTVTSPMPVGTTAHSPRLITLADAKHCPVTLPRPTHPPGVSSDVVFGWGASYGDGKLWVGGLWPHGVLDVDRSFVARDGSVRMKFGWWRAVPGKLRITGRRLDAPAPPAKAEVPAGYGRTGFQASGVIFPTEGCWEITGTLPTTSLTFVTFVIKK